MSAQAGQRPAESGRELTAESRAVHFAVTVMGAVAGSTPAILAFGRDWVVWAVLAVAAVVALFFQRKLPTQRTHQPTAGGVLMAGGAALFPPATGAFFALLIAGAVDLGALLIGWLAGALGFDWRPAADTIGFGLFVTFLFVFGVGFFAMAARGAVWPSLLRASGTGLGLDEIVTRRSYPLATVWIMSFLAVAAGAVLTKAPPAVRWGLVQLGLVLFAAPWWQAVSLQARHEQSWSASRALADLLGEAGYEIESLPGSHRPEFAPLISGIDLLAHRADRWLAIEVKASGESAPARAASGLSVAAMALSSEREQRYEAVLVLLDAAETPNQANVRASGARIVPIPSATLAAASSLPEGSAKRRQKALWIADQLTEGAT